MSFWNSKTIKIKNPNKKIRQERRIVHATFKSTQGILPSQRITKVSAKRASAFISTRASVTVEASLAVPIFFFAVVCLLYLMEIMAIQTSVRAGLQYAQKRAAQDAVVLSVAAPQTVQANVVNVIGADRLERSIVEGGSGGIDCSASMISPFTGIGTLSAKYKIRIPIPMFHIALIPYEETMRIKTWSGYEKGGLNTVDKTIVYVTETGIAYHKDYHCTHLDLSIHMAAKEDISTLRNESGGRYHACERCGGKSAGGVYITNTGDRYHSSLSCSGLKRTVYAVPISEVAGKKACSKCGG